MFDSISGVLKLHSKGGLDIEVQVPKANIAAELVKLPEAVAEAVAKAIAPLAAEAIEAAKKEQAKIAKLEAELSKLKADSEKAKFVAVEPEPVKKKPELEGVSEDDPDAPIRRKR